MKKVIAVAATLLLSGAVLAQTPSAAKPAPKPAAAVDQAEAAQGEVIYMRYCAACHGRSLKGDGPVASGLRNKPTDLTTMTEKNAGAFPYEKVAGSIDGRQTTRVHGTPDMPVWGEVFAVTSGTEAPSAEAAVKRITHYVWAHQVMAAPPKK
ncbi:MAG: cytochrome c [Vicinamibacteria bacterium]